MRVRLKVVTALSRQMPYSIFVLKQLVRADIIT